MRNRQIHLDFHTSEKIEGIGEKFSKEQFQQALKAGHVDSITVFSKCHHGWAYHPSSANEIHPHLKFDLLGAQIEAAHEIDVKTPIYLSAGYDEKAARAHHDWIAIGKHGDKPDFSVAYYHRLCFNTPYLDYLLAQVKEVLERYDGDGIFLDIVGVHKCYCASCCKTMQERGWDIDDEKKALQLAEEVYANYTKRVRETVDSVKMGHKVFHNGGHIRHGRRDLAHMNTHLELESLPTGGWGYDHFPVSAGYARTLGMDYLGMTGKFHKSWGEFGGFKHPNALRYEAMLSVANGASVSVGDQLHPSGEMDMVTYNLIGKAYKEVEEIEPWLSKGKNKADVALFSVEALDNYYDLVDADVAGRDYAGTDGAARILLEGKYLFDVVDTEADFSPYKVLILPDRIVLNDTLFEKISAFIENGGKVLASGTSGMNREKTKYLFSFGAEWECENPYQPDYIRPLFPIPNLGITDFLLYEKGQKLKLTDGVLLAERMNPYFNRTAEHFCSHRHAPCSGISGGAGIVEGKDGILIGWDIFKEYATSGTIVAKELVKYVLDRLLGEKKTLKTNLGAQGVVSVIDCGDFIRNHILYCSPVKRGDGVEIVEDIVPVYNVDVEIRTDKKIKNVLLAPQKESVPFKQENGTVSYTVPKIENHQLVVLECE